MPSWGSHTSIPLYVLAVVHLTEQVHPWTLVLTFYSCAHQHSNTCPISLPASLPQEVPPSPSQHFLFMGVEGKDIFLPCPLSNGVSCEETHLPLQSSPFNRGGSFYPHPGVAASSSCWGVFFSILASFLLWSEPFKLSPIWTFHQASFRLQGLWPLMLKLTYWGCDGRKIWVQFYAHQSGSKYH